ncbi:pyridoxal-phosphate dependent enzyme [Shewanella sp. 202IG2-18]|uniref:pyridoxal-phosphate dependent enzyme n=1 Tax=Parashewanella hymeniacidonis TaxID=2807618 RepID=UPI001961B592|nr:pyridoxal-phosphate dependent enzyme [Parashewanella hymeniacidonis]
MHVFRFKFLSSVNSISYKKCPNHCKYENHNLTNSFKIRGGINVLHHVKQGGYEGVVTFSTGNHGLSVATAARLFGLKAKIVVPFGSNQSKISKIKATGAELIEFGSNFDEAASLVNDIAETEHLYFVHPANEPELINGVATEFLEAIEQQPDIDTVILPIGGGSELAAAVTVLKSINPKIEIIAVQAEASSAAYQSWKCGRITSDKNQTFAGGFATGTAYTTTFDIYKDALTDFVLLTEDDLWRSIGLVHHYTSNLVEGAGASCLMAAYKVKEQLQHKKVMIQISGANACSHELKKSLHYSTFETGCFE